MGYAYAHVPCMDDTCTELVRGPWSIGDMKASEDRSPWRRPKEHPLAVKWDIIDHQIHLQRVEAARNQTTVDTAPPECTQMPHLVTRPRKKKMQEERQQEIAVENLSLMHRLASIMKEDRRGFMQKFPHLSVEFREGLRRKKTLKLQTWDYHVPFAVVGGGVPSPRKSIFFTNSQHHQTRRHHRRRSARTSQAQNQKLARAIKRQKPTYNTAEMRKDENKRQVLLKSISRADGQKRRSIAFVASGSLGHPRSITRGGLEGSRSAHSLFFPHSIPHTAAATAALVEGGVIFRPSPIVVRLRTATQMKSEVAKRTCEPQGRPATAAESGASWAYDSVEEDVAGIAKRAESEEGVSRVGQQTPSYSPPDSVEVKRRAYSSSDTIGRGRSDDRGVVLEINHNGARRGMRGEGQRRGSSNREECPKYYVHAFPGVPRDGTCVHNDSHELGHTVSNELSAQR